MKQKFEAYVAILGDHDYIDAPERVLHRLQMLVNDWPKHEFTVVTGDESAVDHAAAQAADELKLRCITVTNNLPRILHLVPDFSPNRVIFFGVSDIGAHGSAEEAAFRGLHVEIWDDNYEPAGALINE